MPSMVSAQPSECQCEFCDFVFSDPRLDYLIFLIYTGLDEWYEQLFYGLYIQLPGFRGTDQEHIRNITTSTIWKVIPTLKNLPDFALFCSSHHTTSEGDSNTSSVTTQGISGVWSEPLLSDQNDLASSVH